MIREVEAERLLVDVFGMPAPQGSKRAIPNRHTGRVALVESSAKVKPWREAVKWAARDAVAGAAPLEGELAMLVVFFLPRPKGHYGTGRNAGVVKASAPHRPSGKPDLDKLARSTLDGLGEAGVWRDDAQVTSLTARKVYADWCPPGARITVWREFPSPPLPREVGS